MEGFSCRWRPCLNGKSIGWLWSALSCLGLNQLVEMCNSLRKLKCQWIELSKMKFMDILIDFLDKKRIDFTKYHKFEREIQQRFCPGMSASNRLCV